MGRLLLDYFYDDQKLIWKCSCCDSEISHMKYHLPYIIIVHGLTGVCLSDLINTRKPKSKKDGYLVSYKLHTIFMPDYIITSNIEYGDIHCKKCNNFLGWQIADKIYIFDPTQLW